MMLLTLRKSQILECLGSVASGNEPQALQEKKEAARV